MALYSRPSYPEPSYKERAEGKIDVRTYDALIQVLKLRDYSEENPPVKYQTKQKRELILGLWEMEINVNTI